MIFLGLDLTIIFSVSALIVSIFTLWFTHLKGPDIELCKEPEVKIKDWTTDELQKNLFRNNIPNILNFKCVDLVFVNNGSRSGAITEIKPIFKPNEEFKVFYKDQNIKGSEDYYDVFPISIPEGGNCLVEITGSVSTINWFEDFREKEIKNLTNIRKAVLKSANLNKKTLEQFTIFLKRKPSLGVLNMDMTYLKRKWLKPRVSTRKLAEVEVECNCEIMTEGISKNLEKWDSQIITNKMLRRLPSEIHSIIYMLDECNNRLESSISPTNAPIIDELGKHLEDLQKKKILNNIVFKRENKIIPKLEELNKQIKLFNYKISLVKSLQEEADDKQIKDLNEERILIRNVVQILLSNLKILKNKIINEIQIE